MSEAKPCQFPGCKGWGPEGFCIGHARYKGLIVPDKKEEEKPAVEKKKAAPKKKNATPKKRSKKQGAVIRKAKKAYILFLARPENKYCAIQIESVCTKVATVVNHIRGRYANTLNEKDWQPACVKCNGEAENQHKLAKEKGAKLPQHGTGEKYVRTK